MVALIAALAVGLQGQGPATEARLLYPGDPADKTTRFGWMIRDVRINQTKLSPKKLGAEQVQWPFDWVIAGYGRPTAKFEEGFKVRFRLYSQTRKTHEGIAQNAIRTLLRLWDYSYERLRIDHSPDFNNKIVDVYFTHTGPTTGGEQLFDVDEESPTPSGGPGRVNTIYIYDCSNLTDPVEALREVVHEYGHAVLWPIGGFTSPEDWGNGYLGEKLFMRYLRDELRAKRLQPVDSMGVSLEQLDGWVKAKVDPLVKNAALNGPSRALGGDGPGAMDAFIGLSLYCDQILPTPTFLKTMKLTTGRGTYQKVAENAVEAVSAADATVFDIPAEYREKPFWIPVGAGRVVGANVEKKAANGWALVRSLTGVVTVKMR